MKSEISQKREVWPRGLRRADAANYVGVSPSQFDKWIDLGLMPKSRKIGGVVLWDRHALDDYLTEIFTPASEAETAVWDDVRA